MFEAWSYKKTVSLSGQSGAGTDYQVKLLIGLNAAASGADFHLEGNSANFPASKNDGGDLRFSNSAEDTELSFWVEEVTANVATVWVKVGDNLDTAKDIVVFYGNAAASNASDGSATFIIFDDFTSFATNWDVASYGTAPNWTETQNADDVECNGTISNTSHSNGRKMSRKTALPSALSAYGGLAIRVKVQRGISTTVGTVKPTSDFAFGFYQSGVTSFGNYGRPVEDMIGAALLHRYNDATEGEWYDDARDGATASGTSAGDIHNADTDWNTSQVYELKAIYDSLKSVCGNAHHSINRTGIASGVFTGMTSPILYLSTSNYHYTSGATTTTRNIFDWVCVRKVQDTEPAFSSAGSEQSNGASDAQSNLLMFM